MGQYIHVTKETRQKLMKVFNCTSVMIWKALTFESDSELACKIRKAAFANFGILMTKVPVMETIFDHDGYMHQYLPNGAMLEIGKTEATKGGAVFFKGVKVKHFDEVMCDELESIQNWAMTLR